MPGCLRTGMSGVAWLVLTEGERDDFICRCFLCRFLLLKECFYRDRDVVCFYIKLLMDLERSVPMFSFRAVLLRFGVR